MKDNKIIIVTSSFAVLICLIISALLFFAITPTFLIILSFTIGVVTGVCISSLIRYLTNIIKNRRSDNEK